MIGRKLLILQSKEKKMKLIIMTKSTFFVEEDKILSALFEKGMDNLHLYKPGTEPVYSERLLTLLPEDYYSKITVHDHFYLKEEYRLRGIHLNDCQTEPPQRYKGNISRTCHQLEELKEAKKNSSYVFLNIVFDSQGNLTMKEELKEASRRGLIDKKVYAQGDISLDTIRQLKDLGFGGVVICDDLWNRFNIHNEQDYKELIGHFEKLRKATS